ncbi:AraC family transcriptional regulator [Mitsuaria sp. WAJ17]|uniref:AraC family transcriptional regulator n=1 Tax=Mitsuaria sp. WAJ17 TaxID=2761452 RepID=UPI0015FFC902|nr:helix-turn-helix domain-containing protein [Mitsuaria sp. WAJ17]MBB2484578.1 AraC family transcriptional regulator [Mitsuaria sp. WAJ17]
MFDRGCAAVHGVMRRVFEPRLAGRGRVLGPRLRPLLAGPVAGLTDRVLSTETLWGRSSVAVEPLVPDAEDAASMCAQAQAIRRPLIQQARRPEALAEQAMTITAAEQGPVSVNALAQILGMSERQLQRLFRPHVGVPPKRVAQRFRLQEAVHRLSSQEAAELATLASSLGFFDQAHFRCEFNRLIGRSSASYRRARTSAG